MVINDYVNNLEENVVSANTFTNTDTPIIQVRYFDSVVSTGSTLRVPYYVSDRYIVDKTEWKLEDTFTTIIKIGSETYKKTTYAGEQFIDIEMPSSAGDIFFSIQCVDSNGVESSMQYFEISVREQEAENVYTMQESDLETYGIVCNDTDDDIAYNNKAALSNLFASVKEGGYTKIIMLNRTYYINYHAKKNGAYVSNNGGDFILFPDNFIIDLNGSTIQAIQSNDLNYNGRIIRLYNNYNTHVTNGYIRGPYDGFDFQAVFENTQNTMPGEGITCMEMVSCKYCSFDNLDISNSVGYDIGLSRNMKSWVIDGKNHVTFNSNKYINHNGDEVDNVDMMTGTAYISLSETFDTLYLGAPAGTSGYYGTQREIFASFYDISKTFICTIKSKQHWPIKIPHDAVYIRVSAYGTSEQLNVTYPYGILVYYENLNNNCEVKNCTIHDTRTIALCGPFSEKSVFKNNVYYNIANESGTWQVTKLFSDFEENLQHCRNVYLINNELKYGDTGSIAVMYFAHCNFIGNRGLSLDLRGGTEGLYCADSYIPQLIIAFNSRSYYPQMFYKSCRIGNISINTTEATNRNDTRVAMENCYIDTKNDSSLLRLRNCKNGAS